METRWSDGDVARAVAAWAPRWGEDLALRTYASRLLGADDRLVLHGGGNTSVKGTFTNRLGDAVPAIFVKASGHDLATIEPEGHPGLDLGYLRRLRVLTALDDEAMANELRTHLFDARSATPSLETLVHAFVPEKFVDHTHADAILALTNQAGGEHVVRDALGDDVVVLGYVRPGFQLARAVADAYEAHPARRGMVWMRHGLMTLGPGGTGLVRGHDRDRDARRAVPRRAGGGSRRGRPRGRRSRPRRRAPPPSPPSCGARSRGPPAIPTGRTAGSSCGRSSRPTCSPSSTGRAAASWR